MSIQIDPENNVAILSFTGEVGRERILSTVEELFERPDFTPDMARVYDFSGLERFSDFKVEQPLAEQIKDFLAEASQRSLMTRATGKLAIVVPSDLNYGISRAYDAFASGMNTTHRAVFRDMQAALDWVKSDVS